MSCVAIDCKSRMGVFIVNNTKVSFHRFPKDAVLRRKWIKNLKRENWAPSPYSRLCSLHFDASCYRKGYQTKILHSDSVPTIFHGVKLNSQKNVRRCRPSRPEYDGASTLKSNVQDEISKLKDLISQQKKKIEKLESVIKRYKIIAGKRARIMKNIKQKVYRQKKKSANMWTIIMI